MYGRSAFATAAVLAIAVCGFAMAQAPEGAPPAPRPIPGVTAPDAFPRGCVDCHVDRPDLKLDTRLSTFMKQWQGSVDPAFLERARAFTPAGMTLAGKHPKAEAALADIPKGCLACHSRSSKTAPPFARLLHGIHLVGGEKNHFLTMFQGECTHCHKLDPATGSWSIASGAEK